MHTYLSSWTAAFPPGVVRYTTSNYTSAAKLKRCPRVLGRSPALRWASKRHRTLEPKLSKRSHDAGIPVVSDGTAKEHLPPQIEYQPQKRFRPRTVYVRLQ